MNESINIAEILKDAPKGTKLWSPLFGRCELVGVITYKLEEGGMQTLIKTHPIEIYIPKIIHIDYACFYTDGQFEYWHYEGGECVLFPSKENRDWSTFRTSLKCQHFKPFQKVLIPGIMGNVYYWFANIYSHYDQKHKVHVLIDSETVNSEEYILPYEGNEDKLGKPVD